MPTSGDDKTLEKFKLQIGDKAERWQCHAAAERVFT